MSGKEDLRDNCDCLKCIKAVNRQAEVSTPVSIGINARIGNVEICCDSDPSLVVTDCCNGCKLCVKQRLNLRIPIKYEAKVDAEESEITCIEDC